jgi:transposase-like protein
MLPEMVHFNKLVGLHRKDLILEGIRFTTETKVRLLLEAEDSDKTIQEVGRNRLVSEPAYYGWKRELERIEVNHPKQLQARRHALNHSSKRLHFIVCEVTPFTERDV